jgi:hypothetical protein
MEGGELGDQVVSLNGEVLGASETGHSPGALPCGAHTHQGSAMG